MSDIRYKMKPKEFSEEDKLKSEVIRSSIVTIAEFLELNIAPSFERSNAITKLWEASMWANAAIANEPKSPRYHD